LVTHLCLRSFYRRLMIASTMTIELDTTDFDPANAQRLKILQHKGAWIGSNRRLSDNRTSEYALKWFVAYHDATFKGWWQPVRWCHVVPDACTPCSVLPVSPYKRSHGAAAQGFKLDHSSQRELRCLLAQWRRRALTTFCLLGTPCAPSQFQRTDDI
jgi:hypothetical protein